MIPLRLAAVLAMLALLPVRAASQVQLALPLPVQIEAAGPPPWPVMADGRLRLLCELRITNFAFRPDEMKPVELSGLQVQGDGRVLAAYDGQALEPLLTPLGPVEAGGGPRRLGPGRSVLVYLDLALPPGAAAPRRLESRVTAKDPAGGQSLTVSGPSIEVIQAAPPLIGPPLRGGGWVAAFGLSNPNNHRRSLVVSGGRTFIASRFAVDWVRLGPDGRMFKGDPGANASYFGYGEEVLAVADGRVADITDGIPDNIGNRPQSAQPLTLETIPGNSVVLQIGAGRYVVYGHLQPGSLRVHTGQTVRAGQVLALVGNSGNTLAPHLHFHVMDGPGHNAAEGIPFEFRAFTDRGLSPPPPALLAGQVWHAVAHPVGRRREFPLDAAVVDFQSP